MAYEEKADLTQHRDKIDGPALEALWKLVQLCFEPEPDLDLSHMSPDEKAILDRPITDLNLSVRARKCMVRLGMTTIGENVTS